MGHKKKGKTVKFARAKQQSEPERFKKDAHSFVIPRGKLGHNGKELLMDFRKVMEPYTASSLKAKKNNVLKDFVGMAGPLGVTHIVTFSKPKLSLNMNIMKLPRGPTLSFKVDEFSLAQDVVSSLKRPSTYAKQFENHPLVVLNSFAGDGMHIKLMASMFQNMFPSINVNTVKLNRIRRCVLFNFNVETDTVEFRHYNIKAVPKGMSRGVKKLIQSKVPNMSKYEDISEYILRGGNLSESEAEIDGEDNQVILPQRLSSRGNLQSQQSAIRLTELGPRLTLKLFKIQEGVGEGEVLYHAFVQKTEEEKRVIRENAARKKKLKQMRIKQQEANIRKKVAEKEANQQRSLEGMKRAENLKNRLGDDADAEEEDDDAAYYREEVGKAPDPDLFPKKSGKRVIKERQHPAKKFKPGGTTSKTNERLSTKTEKVLQRFEKTKSAKTGKPERTYFKSKGDKFHKKQDRRPELSEKFSKNKGRTKSLQDRRKKMSNKTVNKKLGMKRKSKKR